jgi:pre-rRNA-processing protein IPI1
VFQDLNLIFCELTSFVIINGTTLPTSYHHHDKQRQVKNRSFTVNITRVSEYIIWLLGESIDNHLASSAYLALLPIMWTLLYTSDEHKISEGILKAAVQHAIAVPSTSLVKEATIEFVAHIILVGAILSIVGPDFEQYSN